MLPHTRKMIAVGFGFVLCAVLLWSSASVWAAGGDLDTTFNPGTGAEDIVSTTALQQDGKIIIGGDFIEYNGTPRNYIARLNTDGSLDTSFDPGTGADGPVMTTAVQSDGKIIIGGAFTSYNGTARLRIARLNTDGSLDTSFDPGDGANATVWTIAVQANGKIIIGGDFITYDDSVVRNRIARLNINGSIDISFDPVAGADAAVYTTAMQANGKIIIGGAFTSYNGTARNRIARLNTDGSLDNSFDPGTGTSGAGQNVLTIVVQSDGQIIICGLFTSFNGTARNRLARLNTNGSLDTSFDPGTGANSNVRTIALQADGKIIAGGSFTDYNGTARIRIARVHTNGSLDTTFSPGTGANNDVYTTALQADGRIIISGTFITYNDTARSKIARLLPAPGAISFSSATYNVNEGAGSANITLTRTGGTDNRVVAKLTLADVTTSAADYRFTPGALDTSFDPNLGAGPAFSTVDTTALLPNGKIIIGGNFETYNGTPRRGIARLNANGSLDTSFDPGAGVTGGTSTVKAAALQADGKIIIGGSFDFYNGIGRTNFARLNSDGSLDTSFNPGTGATGSVLTIALQADGRIIIGGQFSTYDGTLRNRIARLLNNGSLDNSFDPGSGTNVSAVNTTILQADGKVIIGGAFTTFNGTSRNRIARLNLNGSLDTSFDPGTGASGIVLTTAVQTDGKIFIGGLFTSYNGTPCNFMARLNPNGSLDTSFNTGGTGPEDAVSAFALQADGKILVGGAFTDYNGTARQLIARLNTNGSLDTSFDPGTGGNAGPDTIVLQADGRLIIAGGFTTQSGINRNSIARLNGDLIATWQPGDATNKTISLPIVNDTLDEADETLTLALTPLTGAATSGATTAATLTIFDNDLPETSITAVSGAGVYNSTATLTATLKSAGSPLSGRTLSFKLNGNAAGMATTDVNGVATLAGVSLASLNAGTYSGVVEARFAGDAGLQSSTGTGTLTVAQAATTTTVTSSLNPSNLGQTVTFTATVSSSAGTPNGTVQFKIDGANAGSPVTLNASGVATYETAALSVGTHTVVGNYSGPVSVAAVGDIFSNAEQDGSNFMSSSGTLSGGQVVSPAPALSIDNRTLPEGNSGTTNTTFTVALSPASSQTVTVNYATANGTATASTDYAATSGTLTFNPGDTSKTIIVLVNGDTSNEPDETFTVTLSAATNATIATALGTGTITNDDTPSVQFQQALYSLAEQSTQVGVIVSRSGDASLPITVDYQTSDVTALQRNDYGNAAGTLRFAAGESQKTVNILINEDTLIEPTESLSVVLSNPTGGGALGTLTTATIEITDDSDTGAGNSIDEAEAFVRQHYHDFLNREGDASGVAFWASQITSCGADAACVDDRRQNVSAAFFLSIEFQQTGYFYIRLVKSAFGAQPENPRYLAFLRDARQIGEGVVIGQPGADLLLEANRQAFLLEYVQRAEFVTRYPLGQSAAVYVDALFANAGVTPTASERQAAITAYSSGDLNGRAAALRSVAESDSVFGAAYNPAFVLMQYFGYLRRSPDAAPDTDFSGYNFWLGKLNSFSQPGENVRDEVVAINRVKRAEMIRAFLVASEYRSRFGQP